jgi:hypothetical protein
MSWGITLSAVRWMMPRLSWQNLDLTLGNTALSRKTPLVSVRPLVDAVRASRDGHEFHEAWATRILLELLPPGTALTGVFN